MLLPKTDEGILECEADPVSESTLRATHKSYQYAEKTVLHDMPDMKRKSKQTSRDE